ncbi:MAG TPA: fumarylacetoacetate hydrolase family protein [Gemmataceae bacterium]|nr:fumarylacetoacetate hydrolase family protein [Gemmataceae bacterium]
MKLGKIQLKSGDIRAAVVERGHVRPLKLEGPLRTLSDILHAPDPWQAAIDHMDEGSGDLPFEDVKLLAPTDFQEVWAAGVTYKRSQEARERESVGAAKFYDMVYSAARPELFFKAPAYRVSGPGEPVHIRRDSRWNVPEPELALVISPRLDLVGYTIGNDMSSRDIEGENPLYLPQAKFYDRACALGPCITLANTMPALSQITIQMQIERAGKAVFEGSTSIEKMARSFQDLISWLSKETSFPQGVVLLTGTGIVPADDFSLALGDMVHIDIAGIGRLTNKVDQRA